MNIGFYFRTSTNLIIDMAMKKSNHYSIQFIYHHNWFVKGKIICMEFKKSKKYWYSISSLEYFIIYVIWLLRSKYVYKSLFVTKFSNHINRMAKMKSSLPCNICYNDNSYVLIVQLSFVMLTQKQEAVAKWLRRVN